jgi:uncharacterized zinc-type alcohol dehydrogenase-like protein
MIPVKGYAAQSPTTDLAPWNFERRDVGPHDVLIDIAYCGVCHSDLHQIKNEWFKGIFPMVPGHEIVGRVVKVGGQVKNFKAGELAAVGVMVDSCRVCENCRNDLQSYCLPGNSQTYNGLEQDKKTPTYGGYSKNIVVNEDFVLHISDKLDLAATAPLLCAGITTYSPLKHWKVGKGHKLAVLGLGGLGHLGVKFGVALGAEVTVLSTSQSKEQDAKQLGAHHFLATRDAKQVEAAANRFDFILDTVSAEHDINMYLSMLRMNGVHICVGIPPKPSEIRTFSLMGNRRSLAASGTGGLRETQEMLDFCADHNIVADIELINIKDITKAYERMLKGDVRYRFVIDIATL